MLGGTIVPTPGAWFGQSFVLALLVQETMVAILEDGTFLLTHAGAGCGVQSNAQNSPCPSQGQKQRHISLTPASPRTLYAHRARLFCSASLPPFFFFCFCFCFLFCFLPDLFTTPLMLISWCASTFLRFSRFPCANIAAKRNVKHCAPSVCVCRRPTLTHSFSREHKNTVTVTPFSEPLPCTVVFLLLTTVRPPNAPYDQ